MKRLFKVKRLFLLLLLPLIVATTCDDDDLSSGFQTEYFIQNDSSIDLIWFIEGGEQRPVASESDISIGSELNQTTNSILPSASFAVNNVKLYNMDTDDFILVYEQDPIDDALWLLTEPSENRFEYRLIVTDELLD